MDKILRVSLLIGLLFLMGKISAQTGSGPNSTLSSNPLIYSSDTLPIIHIPEVRIYDLNKYNYLKSWRYRRTIYNVKKAYPYALIARNRLRALDEHLASLPTKKAQKDYLNQVEKDVMEEFEDELRHLTITQGIILVKLIDRETGNTSYELIKDIKGGFTAFFWQGIARFFGNNLKLQFDPDDKDKIIEDIVTAIDQGFLN